MRPTILSHPVYMRHPRIPSVILPILEWHFALRLEAQGWRAVVSTKHKEIAQ